MNQQQADELSYGIANSLLTISESIHKLQVSLVSLQVFVAATIDPSNIEQVLARIQDAERQAQEIAPSTDLQTIRDAVAAMKPKA